MAPVRSEMQHVSLVVAGALAVVVIVTTAVIQGNMSERWGEYPELQLFAKYVKKTPMNVGEWRGMDVTGPGQDVLNVAGATGSLTRLYQRGNDRLTVSIVCGRVQDMFYHSPDRCYPAAGFEQGGQSATKEFSTAVGPAGFKTATFLKSDSTGNQGRRIYWSWCATGKWEAPREYKWTFAGRRAAFKMYVDIESSSDQSADDNAAVDFIKVFVPALTETYKPAFESETPTAKHAEKSAKASKA